MKNLTEQNLTIITMLFFALICALTFVAGTEKGKLDFKEPLKNGDWLVKVNADLMTYTRVHTVLKQMIPDQLEDNKKVKSTFTTDDADRKKIEEDDKTVAPEKVIEALAHHVKTCDQVTKFEANKEKQAEYTKELAEWFKDCKSPAVKVSKLILETQAECVLFFQDVDEAVKNAFTKKHNEDWKKKFGFGELAKFNIAFKDLKDIKDQAAVDKFLAAGADVKAEDKKAYLKTLCSVTGWGAHAAAEGDKFLDGDGASSFAVYSVTASIALLALLF